MAKKQPSAQKLQEVISAKVIDSVTSTKESKATTAKKQSKPNSSEAPIATTIKKTARKQAANNLLESVVSQREVKYLYPEDCQDTLSRKSWRQSVRNELRKLEREFLRIEDSNSKEAKEAKRAFEEAQKKYLKKGVKVA